MDQPTQSQNGTPVTIGTSPGTTVESDLGAQLTRIEEKVGLIEALQASKRRRVWFFSLAILCCAIWFIWSILQPVRQIYQNPSAFLQAVEHEETTTFLPILKYELNQQLPKLYAALDQAFQTEWSKRAKRFPSVRDELSLVLNQVSNHLNREGAVRVNVLLDRYQKRLEKDFPEIASDDESLEMISKSLEEALTTVIGTRLHRPFESLGKLRDDFTAIPVPEELHKMSDVQLQEVMLDRINAYLNAQFRPVMELVQGVRQQLAGFENHLLDVMQHLEGTLPAANAQDQNGKE